MVITESWARLLDTVHVEVKDNLALLESVLSFHHMGPGHQSKVVRLGGRYFYRLSRFTRPRESLLM